MDYQPNKIAYITGASSGIGEALVQLLIDEGYFVVGMSRTPVKKTAHYLHESIDLSDISKVQSFRFKHEAEEMLLVNNAGAIGDILPIGKNKVENMTAVAHLNILAPQILMNTFIQQFQGKIKQGHILNISSGAGKYPIDSWGPYCASKAALDLFSETAQQEFNSRNWDHWFCHAIAPGVVDTPMQNEIRSADPSEFKNLQKFMDLKSNQELASPEEVAKKLFRVIKNPAEYENVLLSVRNFE
jgi:benzil reductase ((S)-benzoin forming)